MDSIAASSLNPNKHLKEQFVSNLTGSSMLEIAALSTIVPALVVLRHWIGFFRVNGGGWLRKVPSKKSDDGDENSCRNGWWSCAVSLFVDYMFIVFPVLLFFTVLAEWVYAFTVALLLLLFFCGSARLRSVSFRSEEGSQGLTSFRNTIMSYRVSVVVITCLCILAVDFKIYPRRYAKTESYGTGLMDLGVGSFVVANSLVSKQARGSTSMSWKQALQSISPLLFLGFARLFSTKGVDYQVHVGEYGVHWNFFFTLAAVSILTFIINIHPKYSGIFGFLVLIVYQTVLSYGLNVYLVSNERMDDVISQNKEGFFSIFGYWGMYLIGVYLGYQMLLGNHFTSTTGTLQLPRVRVWILSVLFWFFAIIADNYVERVSRRICNLAYIMLVFAQNFQVLSILTLSDFVVGWKPLVLEDAFNQNLLGLFLLANILTGIVNLSVDTLSTSSLAAVGILIGYSVILSAFAGIAWFYGIKTKFW